MGPDSRNGTKSSRTTKKAGQEKEHIADSRTMAHVGTTGQGDRAHRHEKRRNSQTLKTNAQASERETQTEEELEVAKENGKRFLHWALNPEVDSDEERDPGDNPIFLPLPEGWSWHV